MASSVVTFMMVFVVEYLATQTGGATVNNIFEVRFTDTKISHSEDTTLAILCGCLYFLAYLFIILLSTPFFSFGMAYYL